jgi:hypothetical protein
VEFLEANRGYVLSHHDASIIDSEGQRISLSKLPGKSKKDFSREGLMKAPFLLTLTLCHRNIIKEYPKGYFEVLNGDSFLISLLGHHGKGKFQKEIDPAVYRKHKKGVWSKVKSLNAMIYHERTMRKQYEYYIQETEYEQVAQCFASRNLGRIEKIKRAYSNNKQCYLFTKYLLIGIVISMRENHFRLAMAHLFSGVGALLLCLWSEEQ